MGEKTENPAQRAYFWKTGPGCVRKHQGPFSAKLGLWATLRGPAFALNEGSLWATAVPHL